MQKQLLDRSSQRFIGEFQRDHENAILLTGHDCHEEDFEETPYGNPSNTRYHVRKFVRHSFNVTGFTFSYQCGTRITAQFETPVQAFERFLELDGEECDCETNYTAL